MAVAYIVAAMLIGAGSAIQISLVSAMGRLRGPLEATLVSLVATIAAFTLVLATRSMTGQALSLPTPFTNPVVYLAVCVPFAVSLVLLVKGIAPYFAITGTLAIPALVSAGFLGPRLGVGLYISAIIAGNLIGAVILDHIGAFGIPVHRVDVTRVLGIAALLVGVVLIRGLKT